MTPSHDNLLDPTLGPWLKGFPHAQAPLRRSEIAARRWNVFRGDLPLPLAVVKRAALQRNLGWMQAFVRSHGIAFAPHGKTTMSPQLFRAQLDEGAWGLTVAHVAQARVAVAAGARRVLLANQVLQRADVAEISRLRHEVPGLQLWCLLDSPAQLSLIEAASPEVPLEVLLELGTPGGRTGVRGHEEAVALARRAHASAAVRLAGVECYEGLVVSGEDDADRVAVAAWMQRLQALAAQLDAEGLFETDEVLISAGGSAVFDLVAPALRMTLSRPVTGVLRSGCYLTHDDGRYRRLVSAVERRLGCGPGLESALEVWTVVQSMPEPGLALLSAGRRDVSYDSGLPVPVRWCRQGEMQPRPVPDAQAGRSDAAPQKPQAGAAWTVSALNDQHAYLRLPAEEADELPRVGDRVALGISHPCTTFDKWRWMAVIDEQGFVVDALTTCF